jgi:hypothetical protein
MFWARRLRRASRAETWLAVRATTFTLAVRAVFPQFVGSEEFEEIDIQTAKDFICAFEGEETFAFEDVMEMRLRDAGGAGETAFSGFTAAHALAKIFHEPGTQNLEGHRKAISQRNRAVPESLVPNRRWVEKVMEIAICLDRVKR